MTARLSCRICPMEPIAISRRQDGLPAAAAPSPWPTANLSRATTCFSNQAETSADRSRIRTPMLRLPDFPFRSPVPTGRRRTRRPTATATTALPTWAGDVHRLLAAGRYGHFADSHGHPADLDNGTETANLQLAYAATISGQLLDSSGLPITDGTVTLYQSGQLIASAPTDDTGSYEFEVVIAGHFRPRGYGVGRHFYSGR